MENQPAYYTDLITRYFSGEASPEDIRELEAWVSADPENRLLFTRYRDVWKNVIHTTSDTAVDLGHEWDELKSKIGIQSRRPQFVRWSLRAAAVIILLAVPAFILYRYLASASEKRLAAGQEVAEYRLPDGTRVTLDAGAVLEYPSGFDGAFRKVRLKGKAWFEVSHDPAKPFIIAAENVRIQVVGTSFFVNTGGSGQIKEVVLATGKIRLGFEDDPAKTAILSPGERAEMSPRSHVIHKTSNEDPNFLSWKTHHMVFDNAAISQVASVLAGVYHVNIRVADERVGNCRITATFDRQTLESVLNVLKATLDLQVRNNEAGIEFSGHGCR